MFGEMKYLLLICLCSINLYGQVNDSLIYWNNNTKLKWSDFKMPPNENSTDGAITASGIKTKVSFKKDTIVFIIKSHFSKNESWVKKNKITSNLLKHEQLHFDITELFARKYRNKLKEHIFYSNTANKEYHQIYNTNHDELNKYQDLYDAETNHSKNEQKQIEWENRISKELKELEKYSSSTVKVLVRK